MSGVISHAGVIAEQVAYLLKQGGWVMLAIFLLGQAGWFLVVERWWAYRNQTRGVLNLLDADQAAGRDPEELAKLEKRLLSDARLRGLFAEIVRGLVQTRHDGEAAMVRKTREIIQRGAHNAHRHLGTIAAVASAAPMLGLAGTVGGVMVTFEVITVYGIGNPSMMAGGIAEALMVTEAALVVALPLMILHDRLHSRAEEIEAECIAGASRLIRVFSPGAPGAGAPSLSIALEGGVGNHGNAVKV